MPSAVVIARHYYPSPGAATNRIGALVSALISDGWDVSVVSRRVDPDPGGCPEFGPRGERIIRVSGDSTSGVGVRRIWDLAAFPARVVLLARGSSLRAELVVADPPPTVGLALLILSHRWNSRSVYYYADSWHDLLRSARSRLGRALAPVVGVVERFVLRRSDRVLAVTEGLANRAHEAGGVPIVARNGVDGAVFTHEPSEPRETFSPPVGRPYFLYAGNFGEAHGATVLAEAADRLWSNGDNSFAVIFMGYGSDLNAIDHVARRWPGKMKVLPPQSPEITASAFRQAVGGLASVRDEPHLDHAVSVKALASVMCGTPLIYVGTGGFANLVESERMGSAVPHSVERVGEALLERIAAPWAENARTDLAERVKSRFDNRVIAKQVVASLRVVVSS